MNETPRAGPREGSLEAPTRHAIAWRAPDFYDEPALFKELGELRYKLKGQKSELEPKEDMMIRLGRSPDFCDALTMTFRDEALQGL